MTGFRANQIIIIDAVPEGELQTGRQLETLIIDLLNCSDTPLTVKRVTCQTGLEVSNELSVVLSQLQESKIVPIIHFEGHADREFLELPHGEKLPWSEIFATLRKINILCCNNLFVSSGACHSAWAIKHVSIWDACPVYAFLAPREEISAGNVFEGFSAFYNSLLVCDTLDEAHDALLESTPPNAFSFFDSFYIFKRAAKFYLKKECRGKGRRLRQERLLSGALNNHGELNKQKARKVIKNKLRESYAPQMARIYQKFLVVDVCPENKTRFPFDPRAFELQVLNGPK